MINGMRKKMFGLILALAIILSLAAPALAVPVEPEAQLEALREIEALIHEFYLGGTDVYTLPEDLSAEDFDETQDFFYDELVRLLESLDEYSDYYPAELAEYFFGGGIGEPLIGIGVSVDADRPCGAYILRVVPGSPAEQAGIKTNDEIVSADGINLRGLSSDEIVPLLRGREGTEVTIGVRKPGATEDEMITLERKLLQVSNVTGQTLENGVAYIDIRGYDGNADVSAFASLMERFGTLEMRNLIIDLRSNGGGIVEVMSEMLQYLPGTPDEVLFTMSNSKEELVYTYQPKETWMPENILVLVDGYSASAAEIMAGSLSDRGVAVLVGVQTYGKSRAQQLWQMDDGDMLAITTYKIELPVTGDYQAVGLTPDYEVELEVETLTLDNLDDLNPTRAMIPKLASPSRVLALEQRLSLLGYFFAVPDEVFDGYTLHALQGFQYAEELVVTNYASVRALLRLEGYMEEFEGFDYIAEDTQMAYALELLEE